MLEEQVPLQPPEPEYISARYVIRVPARDEVLRDRWRLRLYAEKLLEERLGDEVQLTSLKIKKPKAISKSISKIRKKEPKARLYITIKF
ncbi:hypothetical protein KW789_01200 [Candidatus Saccharibacteria bacterium]|jgi:hypothetical protein|nr:hypothetical protein [Candidatus Saccharibacteria bacterium]